MQWLFPCNLPSVRPVTGVLFRVLFTTLESVLAGTATSHPPHVHLCRHLWWLRVCSAGQLRLNYRLEKNTTVTRNVCIAFLSGRALGRRLKLSFQEVCVLLTHICLSFHHEDTYTCDRYCKGNATAQQAQNNWMCQVLWQADGVCLPISRPCWGEASFHALSQLLHLLLGNTDQVIGVRGTRGMLVNLARQKKSATITV